MTITALRAVADRVTSPEGVLWDMDGLTEAGDMVYTEGDCWALAWHLHQLLSRDEAFEPQLFTLGRRDTWCHVVVRVGEDEYLDSSGVKSKAQMEAAWFGERLVPVPTSFLSTVGKFQSYLDVDFVFRAGHSEANRVADLLIEQHLYS